MNCVKNAQKSLTADSLKTVQYLFSSWPFPLLVRQAPLAQHGYPTPQGYCEIERNITLETILDCF